MNVSGLLECLQKAATAKAVYGDSIAAEGKIIIPVARVRDGVGGGGGSQASGSGSASTPPPPPPPGLVLSAYARNAPTMVYDSETAAWCVPLAELRS